MLIWGDCMPNFEELYYTARNKYYQAIEAKNNIQRRTSELQGRKSGLISELGQRSTHLRDAKRKLALLQDAENKCRAILNDEFETMRKNIQRTAEEYKKIISSDKGVADIQEIYNEDINSTQNDLNAVLQELERKRKDAENEVAGAQQSLDQCNNELNDVSRQLSNTGSVWYAQSQVNNYFAQMKEYQRKWENGC